MCPCVNDGRDVWEENPQNRLVDDGMGQTLALQLIKSPALDKAAVFEKQYNFNVYLVFFLPLLVFRVCSKRVSESKSIEN